jgi:hypothetical protein
VDDEHVRQRMEISGEEVLVCDRCGRPFPPRELHLLEPISPLAAVAEELRVCDACRLEVERGEVVLAEEADDY